MRYIPVHTGQICVVLSLSERAKVHPRVYGADSPTTVHPVPSMGSSPCIRGRCDQQSGQAIVLRFIPVHTGQIRVIAIKRSYASGSSPCVRGRFPAAGQVPVPYRFIPVCTGQILNFPKVSEATKSPIPS